MTRLKPFIALLITGMLLCGAAWPEARALPEGAPPAACGFEAWNLDDVDIRTPMHNEEYVGKRRLVLRGASAEGDHILTLQRRAAWPMNWYFPEYNYVWLLHQPDSISRRVEGEIEESAWSTMRRSVLPVLGEGWFPNELKSFAEAWIPPIDTAAFADDCTFEHSTDMKANLYLRYQYDDLRFICLGEFNIGKTWLFIQVPKIDNLDEFKRTLELFVTDEVVSGGAYFDGSAEQNSLLEKRIRFESERLNAWVLPRRIWVTSRKPGDPPRHTLQFYGNELDSAKENYVETYNILLEVPLN